MLIINSLWPLFGLHGGSKVYNFFLIEEAEAEELLQNIPKSGLILCAPDHQSPLILKGIGIETNGHISRIFFNIFFLLLTNFC